MTTTESSLQNEQQQTCQKVTGTSEAQPWGYLSQYFSIWSKFEVFLLTIEAYLLTDVDILQIFAR